jgi:hypothetical protein
MAAFRVMEGSSEVKCLTYMLQPGVMTTNILSQDTISFISNNENAIGNCAQASGTRIPGFAAGKCTSKGMAVDCSGKGVCEEDSSGRVTLNVCSCNKGFNGKFCGKIADVSEVQRNFRGACAASDCANGGRFIGCQPVDFAGDEVQLPDCECVGGFFGDRCEQTAADVERVNTAKAQTVELSNKLEEVKQTKLTACSEATKPFACPNTDALDASIRGNCVTKLLDCYAATASEDDGDGDGDGGVGGFAAPSINTDALVAVRRAIETKRDECVRVFSGAEIGDMALINACAELLAPVRACEGRRCADGSCAPVASKCGTGLEEFTTAMCTDATKPVLCADSITCKENEKECAKAVAYNGCGPGKVACPARPSVCGNSVAECEKDIGCTGGLQFCGFKRIKGAAVINEGNARPEAICKAKCDVEIVEDPEAKEFSFSSAATEEVVITGSTGSSPLNTTITTRPAMKMRKTSAAALTNKLTGTTATPSLLVTAVSDSYKQNGPFSNQESTLLSAIISIEPSTAVDVEAGQLEMCFALNDTSLATVTKYSAKRLSRNPQ